MHFLFFNTTEHHWQWTGSVTSEPNSLFSLNSTQSHTQLFRPKYHLAEFLLHAKKPSTGCWAVPVCFYLDSQISERHLMTVSAFELLSLWQLAQVVTASPIHTTTKILLCFLLWKLSGFLCPQLETWITKSQLRVLLHNPFKNEFARTYANIYPLSGLEHISRLFHKERDCFTPFPEEVPAIKPSPGPVWGKSPAGSPPWLSPLHVPLNAAIQSRLGKVLTV